MPSVCIHVRKAYTESEETAIMNAVHAWLVTAFGVKAEDTNIMLMAHRFPSVHVPDQTAAPWIDHRDGQDQPHAMLEGNRGAHEAVHKHSPCSTCGGNEPPPSVRQINKSRTSPGGTASCLPVRGPSIGDGRLGFGRSDGGWSPRGDHLHGEPAPVSVLARRSVRS